MVVVMKFSLPFGPMAVVQETVELDTRNLCEKELPTLLHNTGEILFLVSDYKHGASAEFGDKCSVPNVCIK